MFKNNKEKTVGSQGRPLELLWSHFSIKSRFLKLGVQKSKVSYESNWPWHSSLKVNFIILIWNILFWTIPWILTGKTAFYSIQYKNLLKYKLGCSWHFSYVYTINEFLYILLSHIKEHSLKNVIHEVDRNEWLLLSAFQQGLRQKLSWFLS